jgi:hypothetical protein
MFNTKPKSVASIMATFTKTIDELKGLAETKVNENAKLSQEIVEKELSKDYNYAEIDRATKAIKKLEQLVN